MSGKIISVLEIYKTLSNEEKIELTRRLFVIDPTPYGYVDMSHNQEKIITDDVDISYGNRTYVTRYKGSYEHAGYYSNLFLLEEEDSGAANDAALFEIDTKTTNLYTPNTLDEDKYHYEFFGAGNVQFETIEQINFFGYQNGFFAISENYYYLLPYNYHIWKACIPDNIVDCDIYELYNDNKHNQEWLEKYTNVTFEEVQKYNYCS